MVVNVSYVRNLEAYILLLFEASDQAIELTAVVPPRDFADVLRRSDPRLLLQDSENAEGVFLDVLWAIIVMVGFSVFVYATILMSR